MKQPIKKNIIL